MIFGYLGVGVSLITILINTSQIQQRNASREEMPVLSVFPQMAKYRTTLQQKSTESADPQPDQINCTKVEQDIAL